jgi:hypothetical protein
MTTDEAKQLLNKYDVGFDIEDSSFGDGSHTVQFNIVFDSKDEATEFVEAIKKCIE